MTVPQGLPPLSRVSAFDLQQPYYDYEPDLMAVQVSNYAKRQFSSSSSSASSSSYGRGSPDPAPSVSSWAHPACASNTAHRPPVHAHEAYPSSLAVPRLPSPLSTGYALVATIGSRSGSVDTAVRQVSTPGILSASKGRRKNPEALTAYTCPLDGCTATFTREFNLSSASRAHGPGEEMLTRHRPPQLSLWSEALCLPMGQL
jgi:hypothetical protein